MAIDKATPRPWRIENRVIKASDGSNVTGLVPSRMSTANAELIVKAVNSYREWEPIESAPKDGTDILLVWDWDSGIHTGRSVVQASWYCRKHNHSSRHHDCPNESDCDMGWDHYAGEFPFWMPLPPAPETALAAK